LEHLRKRRRLPGWLASRFGKTTDGIANPGELVNQDPMSPNFDLEAFFEDLMKQKA